MIQDVEKNFKLKSTQSSLSLFKEMYSHDMRSIFSKIIMSADLGSIYLNDPENSIELEKLLDIIKEQVNRGNQIISDLNKLSYFNNEIKLIRSIKIHDILEDAIHYIKKSNEATNISIKVESCCKSISVQANDLLKDIFENILTNAINYNNNPIREIYIKISREFDKKKKKIVKIEFIDNGIGIPDSEKENVFIKNSPIKGGKGMGLGLSLVKQIIENFNGNIWVEDRIRGDHLRGSTFILVIPEN